MAEEQKPKEGPSIDDFVAKYEACGQDIANVEKIEEFDDLRKKVAQAGFKRAMKEKDPAAKHEALTGVFNNIKQELAYFAGKAGLKAEDEDLVEKYIRAGIGAFEDHYGAGRRRR